MNGRAKSQDRRADGPCFRRCVASLLSPALLLACQTIAPDATAQGVVPFTTATDRFVVFDRGRFVELEPRKPRQVALAGNKLVYVDDEGALKVYHERGDTRRIREESPVQLVGSSTTVAFTSGDRLGMVKAGAPVILSDNAREVWTSDSLIVWTEHGSGSLHVWWNGTVFPLEGVKDAEDAISWWIGSNTFVWHRHRTGVIEALHRGRWRELADSCDAKRVACGGDVIAFWDDRAQKLKVFDHGTVGVLDEFRPIDLKAAEGIVAYTSATLKFHVHAEGRNATVLDHPPTSYWVQDSVVVFIDRGYFWTVEQGEALPVAEYVPEQWSIHEGTITYLGLNREIHSYHHGRRSDLSKGDAAIERYEPFGDAVLYRDQHGVIRIAWDGRVWEY